MPTTTIAAPISGSQNIAGVTTPQGFASAQMLVGPDGVDIGPRNHLPVASIQDSTVAGFSAVGASVLDPFFVQTPIVDPGVTYNQGAGSLNILTGTTTNAEFLARSVSTFTGAMRLRSSHILSQRIANQNFALLLADLLIENAAYTIVSSTQVNVNWTAHGYTSQMVGQSVLLGGITGAAGVPGRYAIASIVNADTIQFTVAGWPASGSGTLTLFGRNYVRNLFTGVTPTNVAFDVQRNGWGTGDTTATINTTASPGVILANEITGRDVWLSDALRVTSTAPDFVTRASRYENIPEIVTNYYVFLWVFNGTTAPASTTTWTLGHIAVEEFPNQSFYLQGIRAQGNINALAVKFAATPTVTANIGTGSLAAGTNAIGDFGVQYRGSATGAASVTPVTSPLIPAGQSVKGSAGRVVGYDLENQATTRRFVKFFNATSVTMGTTSALFEVALDPAQSKTVSIPGGVGFATGIMIAVTSGRGLTDNTTTGVALGDVTGFVAFA